ncbi:MAG: hypothetical protein ILP14_14680 [Oscillospiraceae bacterium]|nr:hypothetical protein [Oscillospiraceae bacterium]
MKKSKCSLGMWLLKLFLKLLGIGAAGIAVLFVVFFFDLDGKLMYYVVEPFLVKHYDKMERKDTLKDSPYSVDKYPKREFQV